MELPVAGDVTFAKMLSAELEANEVEHRLILASDPYVGLEHTSPHRLMCNKSDEAEIREVMSALGLAAAPVTEDDQPFVPFLRRQRGARRIFAWLLVAAFVLPTLIGGTQLLVDVFF